MTSSGLNLSASGAKTSTTPSLVRAVSATTSSVPWPCPPGYWGNPPGSSFGEAFGVPYMGLGPADAMHPNAAYGGVLMRQLLERPLIPPSSFAAYWNSRSSDYVSNSFLLSRYLFGT